MPDAGSKTREQYLGLLVVPTSLIPKQFMYTHHDTRFEVEHHGREQRKYCTYTTSLAINSMVSMEVSK